MPKQQSRRWPSFWHILANPRMAVAAGLIVTSVLTLYQYERVIEDFRFALGKRIAALPRVAEPGVDETVISISGVARFFQRAEQTDYDSLNAVASRLRLRYRDLESLSWIARIEGGQQRVDSASYPVVFTDIAAESKRLVGLDAGSDPLVRLALEEARNTGEPVMTKSQRFLRGRAAKEAFLVVFPLYAQQGRSKARERTGDRQAFVIAVLRAGQELSWFFASPDLAGSVIRFVDNSEENGQRSLCRWLVPSSANQLSWKSYLLPAGPPHVILFRPGKEFAMMVTPGPHYVQQNLGFSYCLVFAAGCLSTIVLTLSTVYGRRRFLYPEKVSKSNRENVVDTDRLPQLVQTASGALTKPDAALARQSSFLKTLVESSNDGVLVVDDEGRKVLQNRRTDELFGRTPQLFDASKSGEGDDAGWGRDLHANLLYPDQVEERENYLVQHPEESLQDEIELTSGTILERHSFPVFGENGESYGRIQVFHDITKLVETERTLRWNTTFLEAVINSSHDGILVIDWERKRVFRNRKAFELLNLPQDNGKEGQEWDESLLGLVSNRKQLEDGPIPRDERWRRGIQDELELDNGLVFERYSSLVLADDGTCYGEILFFHDITERKQAEEALRRNEATLRLAFSSSPVGIALGDAEGAIEWLNSSLIAMTGYTLQEMKRRNGRILYLAQEEFERFNDQVMDGVWRGNSTAMDTKWVRRDGAVLDVHVSAAAVDPENRSAGFVLTATDITERKRAEEALRESEERYRIAIENSSDGIVLAKGPKLLFVNQKFLQMFGYDHAGQVTYLEDFGVIHPDDRERVMTYSRKRMLGEDAPERYEFKGVKKDGTVIEVEAVVAKVTHRAEPVALVYFKDVTERKAAEQALRESENKFRDLAEKSVVGVYLIQHGVFRYVNAHFAEICGYDVAELGDILGPTDLVLSEDLSRVLAKENARKVGQSDAVNDEFRIVTKQGETRDVEIYSSYTTYKGRRAIIGTLVDVTERKLTERKLQDLLSELESKNRELETAYEELKTSQKKILQQEKMASIGQLAAGVAHEINNPMAFIMSNLDSLQEYMASIPEFIKIQSDTIATLANGNGTAPLTYLSEKRESLAIDYILEDTGNLIQESLDGAHRVKQIVTDLTKFSRVDETRYAMADINRVLDGTLNIVGNQLKYKAAVNKEYAELPMVNCNEGQLGQVFMNLLVNAAQAMDDFGEICIKTWQDEGYICVAVSDSGCGIPESQLNRIFEPFFTTKEIGEGTGLGLSIAYDVVKKHQGEIEVMSTVGKGTTFTVRIPIERNSTEAQPV